MSIKYYALAKDEEPPEEFCTIRHENGEPCDYHWYIPEPKVETDETGFVTRVEIDGRWYVPEPIRCKDCKHAHMTTNGKHAIVRCRDCVYFQRSVFDDDAHLYWCFLHGTDYANPNGFCAWGERGSNDVRAHHPIRG